MKRAIFILVAIAAFALMAGVALAAPPTYDEFGTGASLWTYQDNSDTAPKTEGSYRAYQGDGTRTDVYEFADDASTPNLNETTSGPHGGYNTTTNKCKTCHAVHRATGTFGLLRGDDAESACDYCHVGDTRHSQSEAYYGSINNKYTANGHTIGAGPQIPDSSVLQAQDANGGRTYNDKENYLMKWITHGGRWIRVGPTKLRCSSCHQVHNAVRQVWKPGKSPARLSTTDPTDGSAKWKNGYKLLRVSPSGGIKQGVTGKDAAGNNVTSDAYRLDPTLGFFDTTQTNADGTPYDSRLKAPEGDALSQINVGKTGPGVGGVNETGYTPYFYFGDGWAPNDPRYATMKIYETSLSFYCADCHNLNIAGKSEAPPMGGLGKFSNSMLSDRSHAVPAEFTIRGGTTPPEQNANSQAGGLHCYSCHNDDMPFANGAGTATLQGQDGPVTITLTAAQTYCGACHVTSAMYAAYSPVSDFPHTGTDNGYKLLNGAEPIGTYADNSADEGNFGGSGPSPTTGKIGVRTPNTASPDTIDTICLICHGPQGGREIGYDK